MHVRVLLVPALVAALTTPAVAAPKAPALAGTTRVTVTRPTVIDVRLTRALTMSAVGVPKGASVTGDGRIVGAMLLAADKTSNAAYLLLRYGLCAQAACTPATPYLYYQLRGRSGAPSTSETLPAGAYRLLLVTDGKPVTVTMTFPGLPGKTTLKPPSREMYVRQQTLDFGPFAAPPLQTAYTASAGVDVDGGDGLVLHQFTTKTDASVQQQGGFCHYEGEVAPEPAPGCPTGSGLAYSTTQVKLEPSSWGMVGHLRYLAEGPYRVGPFYRTIGAAKQPVGTIASIVLPR